MPNLWRGVAVACALGAASLPAPAGAQADSEFALIRDWTPIGTVDSHATGEILLLSAGTIHSDERYGDVVFRFDYRLPSPEARAALLVRAEAATDAAAREYAVALEGTESGRLAAVGMPLHETRFTPIARPGSDWTPCEIRIEGGHLTVSIAGTIVAEADRLDALPGRLGFRAVRQGIELRGMRVARLAAPVSAFHPELPKADGPGITPPTLAHQEGPKYPEGARRQGISGKVLLALVITAEGGMTDVSVVSSPHPSLVEAALACVRKWRFKPARKDGAPVAVSATVEVSFDLKR